MKPYFSLLHYSFTAESFALNLKHDERIKTKHLKRKTSNYTYSTRSEIIASVLDYAWILKYWITGIMG
jgi:hypothetical protein